MELSQISVIGIILVNVLLSLRGFRNSVFFRKYLFSIPEILIGRQYLRLISSGFLHVDWGHLLFNMFALYSFGGLLFQLVGLTQFFIIYFVSLIGGNLLSLFINRNKSNYSAVGASGAVSGVIFACIAIYPDVGIYFFFIPFEIPGWIFGPAFILISIFGMQRQSDNIGHEAHLGGAIVGMITTILFNPLALLANPLVIVGILVPTIIFMIYIARKPVTSNWVKQREHLNDDDDYNHRKQKDKNEIDRILDKANKSGWESLNAKELELLKTFADNNKL